MNMRRILKQPTLRMHAGGAYGDDKTAAFVAANPAPGALPPAGAGRGNINPALVMPAAGAGRGNTNPAPVVPDQPAVSPQIMGSGNSFGDAASLRPGSAATPFAQQSNLQQYASQGVAARGAGMAQTSGDWARTTPYMPPGVSPMPAAGAAPAGASVPAPTATAPAKQSRSLETPAGFESTFQPMAIPGLKHGGDLRTGMGGHVPGTGSGDKIAAKYEPGEFVVSNAMLAAKPGLRDMLHDLRGDVLASQGKTVEEADAAAVKGGELRADKGYGLYPYNRPEKDIYAGLGKPASAPENNPGPGGMLAPLKTQGVQDGQNQTAVANARPASAGGATGGWRNSAAVAGVPGSQGRPSGAVSRPEDEFMPGTKAVFNEGGKDIAAALGQGKYTKAAFTGLRQLAAYPVALADDVVGGAVRGAYGMLRNPVEDAGRAMLGMEDRKEPQAAASPPPAQPALREQPRFPGQDATMPGQDPGRAAAAQAPAKLGDIREFDEGAGTMQQFTKGPGGTVAGWTTVSTPAAKAERALRDQQFDAKRRQDFDDATTGPNGWKTRDAERQAREDAAKPMYINARKAFNERRSQDMTLRAATAQNETSRANNAATNSTTLRGQDMDLEGKRATNESNKLRLEYDMGRDARKDLVDELKFRTDEANTQFNQVIAGNEAHYKKVLNSLPPIKGKNGPEANTQAAAAYMTGAQAAVAARADELRKAGNAAGAAALERQGTAGVTATDHQDLLNGMELMKRFTEKRGQWFGGAEGKASNNPMDFVVKGPHPTDPKKVILRGGQVMDMDDVTGTETANRFGLPFWGGGQQTNQYLPK